ncbi:thioredoxin family protein [Haloferula sp.]|uniref:thioredoxin family protein n=1 Tax=Haloferula sp. TaxID=2497595 RepID=UPI00329CECF0
MITIFKSLLVFIATATLALGSEWGSDWEAAKAQAKKEDKPIFINFTGTDWCGWCIKLEKEVFSKKAFQDYAKDHLVLMEVDFPRKKKLSDEVKAQNKKLDKEYKIEGYPTLFLLDADGKKLTGDVGYREGGPDAYVKHLKELIAKAEAKS